MQDSYLPCVVLSDPGEECHYQIDRVLVLIVHGWDVDSDGHSEAFRHGGQLVQGAHSGT